LTKTYRRHYKDSIGDTTDGYQRSVDSPPDALNGGAGMATNIQYEIARIEAKIDILTGLILKMDNPEKSTHSAAAALSASASEQALVRSFTTKQHVTAQLLIAGWSNKDIATVINIVENTVKLHVRAVCKKVGTKTRGQAAMILADIFEKLDPEDYKRASGGLPVDWADTLVRGDQDHYAPLYRSVGGGGDGAI
jgi:DNA-binding CsgD family transcriptional regulator